MYFSVFSRGQVHKHKYKLFMKLTVFHVFRKEHTIAINIFHKAGTFQDLLSAQPDVMQVYYKQEFKQYYVKTK